MMPLDCFLLKEKNMQKKAIIPGLDNRDNIFFLEEKAESCFKVTEACPMLPSRPERALRVGRTVGAVRCKFGAQW